MPVATIPEKHTQDFIELENQFGAHNYHPLDVVIERAEGVWVYDVEGKRYLDCLAAYSAVNQGHCHPRILQTLMEQASKVTLTSRAFRNDQLGLLYQRTARPDRLRHGAADELRRRGRRDGDQDRAQVGLQGQRHPGGQGGDHRVRQQLSRAHGDHRQLLDRRAISRRVRAVHARVQDHSVRRRRGAAGGDHAEHVRVSGGADSGRGGHRDSAQGLPEAGGRDLPRESRAADHRRNSVGAGADRQAVRLHARGHPARHGDRRQGAGRRLLSGVGRAVVERNSRSASTRAIMAARSAAIRWAARWPAPRCGC